MSFNIHQQSPHTQSTPSTVIAQENISNKKDCFIHTDNMQMNTSADFGLCRDLTFIKPCITCLL